MPRFEFAPLSKSVLVLAVGLIVCVAQAGEISYTEDFTTKLYCDTLNTTATWDTVSGELRLEDFQPSLVGDFNTSGNAMGVFVSGSYAYVADGAAGLKVVDISDPSSPAQVGAYATGGSAVDLFVAGGMAYVACSGSGLLMIDVTDPTTPTLVGTFLTAYSANGVAVAGGRAFVTELSTTLEVIDVSDPTTPVLTGTFDTVGSAHKVALSGNYAFVAAYSGGLQSIDISNPSAPFLAGSYNLITSAEDVVVAGDRAYVACFSEGLQVLDISDPTDPTYVGSYGTMGPARGLAISGDRAFVASFGYGLEVIDISDPASPISYLEFLTTAGTMDVAVYGEHACLADNTSGLLVVDIRGRRDAYLKHTTPYTSFSYDITVAGDFAYFLNSGWNDLVVLDISDPAVPAEVVSYVFAGSHSNDMMISGDHAFIGTLGSETTTLDISDPYNPARLAGTSGLSLLGYGVVSGDYIYNAYTGLQVIDISEPLLPAVVGNYPPADAVWGMDVSGGYAYLAGPSFGLRIIDVGDPTNPVLVGSFPSSSSVYDVASSGNYVYLAATEPYGSYFYLLAVDVSDPTNPVWAGAYYHFQSHGLETPQVTIADDLAFLHGENLGPVTIDISDPANPVFIESFDIPGYVDGFTVNGNFAYLGVENEGIQTYEVFYDDFDRSRDVCQSLPVTTTNQDITRVRISTDQVPGVTWELSLNEGVNWTGIPADGTWYPIGGLASTDLRWRSTHEVNDVLLNPTCSSLTLDWLFRSAHIDSMVDVPNDQGGWVYLYFTRSGLDEQSQLNTVNAYSIYRKVESKALRADVSKRGERILENLDVSSVDGQKMRLFVPRDGDSAMWRLGDDYFLINSGSNKTAPPGMWAVVNTVYATTAEKYVALVPALGEFSAEPVWSKYYISAHMTEPGVFHDTEMDSCYSIDNIAPGVPLNFAANYQADGVSLDWDDATEGDFQYYRVYRSEDPGFVPGPGNIIQETAVSAWTDPTANPWGLHYKLTVLDHAGNESQVGSLTDVSGVRESDIPTRAVLHGAVPNPFNPQTTIAFDLPKQTAVRLCIFDLSGRLVRMLIDGEVYDQGRSEAIWNGKDDDGKRVASGTYFYRLEAGEYSETMRTALIK